jgi:nitrate reductase molybdenum cofactor assembly chaperone
MTDEKRALLKLLSLCLAYPDAETLPEMENAAAGVGEPRARERLSHFMTLMRAQSVLKLQEHYTAVFDMNPSASLNLTYHLMGDREDRGRALAELLEVYLRAGFEPAVNELPDFLPLMLEFMAGTADRHRRISPWGSAGGDAAMNSSIRGKKSGSSLTVGSNPARK